MQWISTGMVAAGALILMVSVRHSRQLFSLLPTTLQSKWRILTFLIGLFIVGYGGYLLVQFIQIDFPLQALISTIFFLGALFVYGIISLIGHTLHQLKQLNDNLEIEVHKRTEELKESNINLSHSQQELLRQNNFLHSVINALPHPFMVIEPETYEIILANTAAGFSPFDARRTCHMLSHGEPFPCQGESHPCPILEIRKMGSPITVEHVHYNARGEERIVEVHGYPITDETGQLTQIIEYSIDITEKKQTESELIQAKQAAEEASAAKGVFLANMSHEIRTPMNAILGMSHLALQTELSEKQRDYISKLHHSAGHLLRILNDVLDISKIEAGRMHIVEAPFVLEDCLNDVVNTLQVQAQQKELQLISHIDAEIPATLIGDDLRLRQVLVNLVGNSIKFTDTGSIRIEVSIQGDAPFPDEDTISLHFRVCDTGIGISPEMIDKIFDSFEQANTSSTRKFGGTGLGLSICKQIISLMQGKIWAESQPQRGSCFHFVLPLQRTKPETVDQPVPASLPEIEQELAGLRILLVDDNEVNREVAMMMLEGEHAVTTANKGLEALEKMADNNFDLVLMDVQMPLMDGLSATNVIRTIERGDQPSEDLPEGLGPRLHLRLEGRRMPIVAITAHAMEKDQQRCMSAGMDGYISKPFQYRQMLDTFQRIRLSVVSPQ